MSLCHKLSLASTLVVTLPLTASFLPQSPSADLLLLHGHILTVDSAGFQRPRPPRSATA